MSRKLLNSEDFWHDASFGRVYLFRVVDENNRPDGIGGIVVAQTEELLFWEIDAFVDPHVVQLKPLSRAGLCFHQEDMQDDGIETGEWEMNADDVFSEHGWFTPKWGTHE